MVSFLSKGIVDKIVDKSVKNCTDSIKTDSDK